MTKRSMCVLTVYVERDGLAWLNPSTASPDSTPLNPLASGALP